MMMMRAADEGQKKKKNKKNKEEKKKKGPQRCVYSPKRLKNDFFLNVKRNREAIEAKNDFEHPRK